MAVKIGHSSIDERGKATGGTAGDQTGKEVCIRDWYAKGWTVLLRPKDAGVAERMARACEAGCGNDRIGYDQNQRNTLRTQAKAVGWDLAKITTACECDCSSFMAVCVEAAGVPMDSAYTSGNAPTTRNMRAKFVGTGAFEALTDGKYLTGPDYLRRGDVLVYEGHHTVMVLSDGAKVEPEPRPEQPDIIPDIEPDEEEVSEVFNTMAEIRKNAPWAEATVRKLIDKKALRGQSEAVDQSGDPAALGLTEEMLRVLVVVDRWVGA